MLRLNFYKIVVLLFVVCVGIMSTYMLITLDNIKLNKDSNAISKNKKVSTTTNSENLNQQPSVVVQNSKDFFTPNKKVIVLEKEIIKEVVKEVCVNIETPSPTPTIIKNNENEFFGFENLESLLNYYLTYQNYYMIEEYKDKQYMDKNKYDLSKYSFPELTKTASTFLPTIEQTDKEIEQLKLSMNRAQNDYYFSQNNNNNNNPLYNQNNDNPNNGNQNAVVGVSNSYLNSNRQYQQLLLKKVRSRVWDEFYSNYWRDKYFLKYSKDNGIIAFKQPILSKPLDSKYFSINKPLLSKPYLFMHMPKCGGHTIVQHFRNYFGGGVHQQWAYPNPNEMHLLHSASNVILGHYEFGIHRELTLEQQKTYNYMTMLRDPVDRVISHYFFHKSTQHDEEHMVAAQNTLSQWVIKSPRGNNEMTRVLSGITKNEEFMPNDETFNMALYHLRSMKFVGITEKFIETLALMKFYLGVDNPTEIREKQNAGRLKPTNVTQADIDLIKQRNVYDILIYEECLKMFERQIDLVGRDNYEAQLKKIST